MTWNTVLITRQRVITWRLELKTTDEFLQALPEKNIPANTRKVQQWACNTFHLWRKSRNKFIRDNAQQRIQRQLIAETPLENMTNAEINESWPSFILEAGKIHGEPYPPSILHLLIMGLQGFLHLKGNHLTVLHDTIFKHLKDALDYRMKILTGENLGHKEQAQEQDCIRWYRRTNVAKRGSGSVKPYYPFTHIYVPYWYTIYFESFCPQVFKYRWTAPGTWMISFLKKLHFLPYLSFHS